MENKENNNSLDNQKQEYDEAMLNAKSDLERRELTNNYYYKKEKLELEEEYKSTNNFAERQWILDKMRQLDKNYYAEQCIIDKCKRQEIYDDAMINAVSDNERKELSNEFIYQEAIIELKEKLKNTSDPVQSQLIKELIIQYEEELKHNEEEK